MYLLMDFAMRLKISSGNIMLRYSNSEDVLLIAIVGNGCYLVTQLHPRKYVAQILPVTDKESTVCSSTL